MSGYNLTRRQRDLLAYLSERDECPSFEEMRKALGLASRSGVHRLVMALEERGYIRRVPERARAIEVIRAAPVSSPAPDDGVINIPLFGREYWAEPHIYGAVA